MNKLKSFWIIFVLTVFGSAAIANAAPPELEPLQVEVINDSLSVNVSTEYHFAGYSTATTDGDANGYQGMNEICEGEYSGGRMCTTKEWFNTHGTMQLPPGQYAWVQPLVVATTYRSPVDVINYTEWTGDTHVLEADEGYQDAATCTHWTSTAVGKRGYALHRDGGGPQSFEELTIRFCSEAETHVTCCQLAHVPAGN